MTRTCRVDYPEKQMEHEEEPRADQEWTGARAGSASTSTNENIEAENELVPLQNPADARIDARSVEAPSEVSQGGAASGQAKPTESPALNKWQKFWRGVLHVDTAKMDPWTAARNAIGVALPLAVGIALGMPLGGWRLPAARSTCPTPTATILTSSALDACWRRAHCAPSR